MIMTKDSDRTYSQVGFIKDLDGNDIEFVKDSNGNVIFEKGFTREKSGLLPLQINSIGKALKNYKIYGNTEAVGNKTSNLWNGELYIGSITAANGAFSTSTHRLRTGYIPVVSGKTYIFNSNLYIVTVYAYNNGTPVKQIVSGYSELWNTRTFTVPESTNQVVFAFRKTEDATDRTELSTTDMQYLMVNEGTTALPYEHWGYEVQITTESEDGTESITTSLWLNHPLYKIGDYADFVEYSTQTMTRYCGVDDSGVFLLENPEIIPVELPEIPTLDGVTVIDVDTTVKPSKMDIKYKGV